MAQFTVSLPPPTQPILSFFLFFYLYICQSTTSQSKEHLVPFGLVVTTLRMPHQSFFFFLIRPTERRREQRGRKKKRENLGQILFHTHEPQICPSTWKTAAHINSHALRIHQSSRSNRLPHTDSLAPTLISFYALGDVPRSLKPLEVYCQFLLY